MEREKKSKGRKKKDNVQPQNFRNMSIQGHCDVLRLGDWPNHNEVKTWEMKVKEMMDT